MKPYLFFSLILLISFTAAKAQKPVTLAEDSVKFGNRYSPGFWLSIPEAKPEVVKTNWIKAIEKGTKSKVSTSKNEMTLFGALLPNFTENSVNILSKVEDGDSLTRLFVSVETARDIFVEKSSEEYDKLSAYLKKFGKDQYIIVAKDQLSAEESKLKELDKELKTTRKNKEKFEKTIQSSKVLITEENDNIASANKELEMVDIKIGNSSTLISTMEDGEAKKAKKSELKSLQKKKKSLLKSINSSESSISKANTSIQDNTTNIELNDETQKDLANRISDQKLTIARYQKKLKTIEAY